VGELSGWHWLIVIAVFVLLFGARRLPDAARSLGRSTRILKAELRADDRDPPEEPADGPRTGRADDRAGGDRATDDAIG